MKISSEDLKKIIKGDPRLLVQKAEKFGAAIKKDVTTTQIRNVFGAMKKLQLEGYSTSVQNRLILMKPRLVYMAAKKSNSGKTDLKDTLSDAIDQVNNETTFENFCNFFEAILAYHKASGGK